MTVVKLYTDEDITDDLARVLRARGIDALSTYDVGMYGRPDVAQLEFAISEQRTLLSFNVKHFPAIAAHFHDGNKSHHGIVVSNQLIFSALLRRVLNLVRLRTSEEMVNRFDWLQNYK